MRHPNRRGNARYLAGVPSQIYEFCFMMDKSQILHSRKLGSNRAACAIQNSDAFAAGLGDENLAGSTRPAVRPTRVRWSQHRLDRSTRCVLDQRRPSRLCPKHPLLCHSGIMQDRLSLSPSPQIANAARLALPARCAARIHLRQRVNFVNFARRDAHPGVSIAVIRSGSIPA